jgi:hypothetical protein
MLKINIVKKSSPGAPQEQIQFEEARKSLTGDVLIFDHDLMDIVVSSKKNKVVTFPKEIVSEETYHTQERMLKLMARNGVLERESIRSGSVFSSLEAKIQKSADEEISAFQMVLLEVYKFLQEEQPNIKSRKIYKNKLQDFFLDPSEKDSTELGEVPHGEKKGSMDHQVRPYGYQYMYSILREITER